jgi:acetyl esterase/lipase
LVSLAALDPVYLNAEGINASLIRGVIGIAGAAYDLDSYYASTPMASLLMPAFGSDTAKWAAAAPIRYVQPYAPPFFLAHGLNDSSAPASSTQTLAAALTREGVPTHLELLPNADHFSVLTSVLPSVRSYLLKDGAPTPQPAGSAEQARRRSGS